MGRRGNAALPVEIAAVVRLRTASGVAKAMADRSARQAGRRYRFSTSGLAPGAQKRVIIDLETNTVWPSACSSSTKSDH